MRGTTGLIRIRKPAVSRARGAAAVASEATLAARRKATAAAIERMLGRLLSRAAANGEIKRPDRLIRAMRYAALGGGKRLRPLLALESAALFGVPRPRALMTAAAIECVHCYSLVHDDLPSMDDDALRRGRPTVHRAFDEATAILAGDGLLTLAFDLLARPQTHPDPAVRIALVAALARAAGLGGMVGGQMLDLAAEGRYAPARKPGTADIARLDSMKTGALIVFSCVSGAILGKAPARAHAALAGYGRILGQAFQIADDLLDIEGDERIVGKSTRKDAAQGKATLAGLLGRDAARAKLDALVAKAERALAPFGADAAILRAAARFVATRRT